MKSSSVYVIHRGGMICDGDENPIMRAPIGSDPFDLVRSYVTNVMGKTYIENWSILGRELILTVV